MLAVRPDLPVLPASDYDTIIVEVLLMKEGGSELLGPTPAREKPLISDELLLMQPENGKDSFS